MRTIALSRQGDSSSMQVIDQDNGQKFWLDRTDAFNSDMGEFHASQCQCEDTQIRRRPFKGGGFHFFAQCCRCGRVNGSALKKTADLESSPPWDADASERYSIERETIRAGIIQKHVRIQRDGVDDFEREYSKYLKTAEWANRRAKVLKRAGGICEGCLERDATQVHHKTYEHVFEEFMFELIAVCDECHKRLHPEKNPDVEVSISDTHIFSEWNDGHVCDSCRFASESNNRRWCSISDQYAIDALSEIGECGPKRVSFEPLR